MEIDGKNYEAIPEVRNCQGCAAEGDYDLCNKFPDSCGKKSIIWREVKTDMSVKKEVEDWVAAGKPETTKIVMSNISDGSFSNPHVTHEQIAGTKYDDGKLQYSLVPPYALAEVARNLTAGLQKYKQRNNWQLVPDAEQRYMDALYRHLEAHRRGEVFDTDSSAPDMPHLAAVAVNALFLLEFMLNPNLEAK